MPAQKATTATVKDIGRLVTLVIMSSHSNKVHAEVSGILNAVAVYPDPYDSQEPSIFLHIGAETFSVSDRDALHFHIPRQFPVLSNI